MLGLFRSRAHIKFSRGIFVAKALMSGHWPAPAQKRSDLALGDQFNATVRWEEAMFGETPLFCKNAIPVVSEANGYKTPSTDIKQLFYTHGLILLAGSDMFAAILIDVLQHFPVQV